MTNQFKKFVLFLKRLFFNLFPKASMIEELTRILEDLKSNSPKIPIKRENTRKTTLGRKKQIIYCPKTGKTKTIHHF